MIKEISKQIQPKTSAGHDGISSKLLKDITPIISDTICHIFNLSFKTGYVPSEFKLAKVIPIFKSDDKHEFNNYRPISLLSSLSKLIEKIVAKQLNSYLYKYKILYENQFGFRTKHSTLHPVIKLLDKISESFLEDTPKLGIGIFLDLKKAFYTVNHTILLKKLNFYGIKGVANDWFKNYLFDREQYVSIKGENSSKKVMRCGVP